VQAGQGAVTNINGGAGITGVTNGGALNLEGGSAAGSTAQVGGNIRITTGEGGSSSGTSGILHIQAGATNGGSNVGAMNIGCVRTPTINIGQGNSVAQFITIGSTGGVKTISIGSTTGASSIVLKAGTGGLTLDADLIGFYGVTPTAQSVAYSRAATVVESRALLANASATAANNNALLAALIADLQSLGVLGT